MPERQYLAVDLLQFVQMLIEGIMLLFNGEGLLTKLFSKRGIAQEKEDGVCHGGSVSTGEEKAVFTLGDDLRDAAYL